MGNPTSYQWTFAGGTPATSSAANQTVTYATKGNYNVSLVVTNSSGTSDTLHRGYVSVRSQTNTPYVNTFGDDFELYPIPNENWHVQPGIDTMNFRYFSKTAYNGQSCVTLQNFNAVTGETDEMISHTISLVNSKDAQLTFWYAFASRGPSGTDALRVYASNDCGQNWALIGSKLGPFLRTVSTSINDSSWYPTLNSEWRQGTFSLNNFALSPDPIMLKFEFKNGGGNSFYLDDVFITTTIGSEELFAENGLKIFPNPASGILTVETPFEGGTISLMDISGRTVIEKQLSQNEKVATLQVHHLASGLYLISIQQNGKSIIKKVVVN
jgi:hypothetical protein